MLDDFFVPACVDGYRNRIMWFDSLHNELTQYQTVSKKRMNLDRVVLDFWKYRMVQLAIFGLCFRENRAWKLTNSGLNVKRLNVNVLKRTWQKLFSNTENRATISETKRIFTSWFRARNRYGNRSIRNQSIRSRDWEDWCICSFCGGSCRCRNSPNSPSVCGWNRTTWLTPIRYSPTRVSKPFLFFFSTLIYRVILTFRRVASLRNQESSHENYFHRSGNQRLVPAGRISLPCLEPKRLLRRVRRHEERLITVHCHE